MNLKVQIKTLEPIPTRLALTFACNATQAASQLAKATYCKQMAWGDLFCMQENNKCIHSYRSDWYHQYLGINKLLCVVLTRPLFLIKGMLAQRVALACLLVSLAYAIS